MRRRRLSRSIRLMVPMPCPSPPGSTAKAGRHMAKSAAQISAPQDLTLEFFMLEGGRGRWGWRVSEETLTRLPLSHHTRIPYHFALLAPCGRRACAGTLAERSGAAERVERADARFALRGDPR